MILVVPKKTLTATDKKNLLKKGYVVVECEKPESVRVISPEISVDKSDLFLSALEAMVPYHASSSAEKFVANLHKRMSAEVKPKTKPAVVKSQEQKSQEPKKTVLKEPIKEF